MSAFASCGEEAPSAPLPLDAVIAVSPDSASAWVGDSALFVATVTGPDAHQLSLDSLSWTVSGSAVVSATDAGPGKQRLIVFGGGVTTITARLGTLSDAAVLVAMEEGEILASFPFPVEWYSAPAVSTDGSVYLLRSEADPPALIALDADLMRKWERALPSLSFLNPAIGPSGTIYVTEFRSTSAFAPDGALLWRSGFAGNGDAAPALDGAENVYVVGPFAGGGSQRRLVRFSPWGDSTQLGIRVGSPKVPATVVRDSVVVWADGRTVWATTRDGVSLWTDTLPESLRYLAPSVGSDRRTLYLPSSSYVVAIDAFTGDRTAEWSIGAAEFPVAPIVDMDGTIYVQTASRLVALNPDLSVQWEEHSLGGAHHLNSAGGPALAAGGILYVNCGRDVCAVHTADGSVRWRRRLAGPGSPGHIAIGPDNSLIFAMHVTVPGSSFIYKLRGRFPLADAPWPMDGGSPGRTRRMAQQ